MLLNAFPFIAFVVVANQIEHLLDYCIMFNVIGRESSIWGSLFRFAIIHLPEFSSTFWKTIAFSFFFSFWYTCFPVKRLGLRNYSETYYLVGHFSMDAWEVFVDYLSWNGLRRWIIRYSEENIVRKLSLWDYIRKIEDVILILL